MAKCCTLLPCSPVIVLLWVHIVIKASARGKVTGGQLFVDDQPFFIRGVCYSPVPIGDLGNFAATPNDFFEAKYADIWKRDLPLIKAMGANVIRIYQWNPDNDHKAFLDAVHEHGLMAMLTFFISSAPFTPLDTSERRSAVLGSFANEVRRYAGHPAVLLWSFGNELNGMWMGFVKQLGDTMGDTPCGWDGRCVSPDASVPGTSCYSASSCAYGKFFSFMDKAARVAKAAANVLVVSSFADVDALPDKIQRAGLFAPSLDMWTVQAYRGASFGPLFEQYANVSDKGMIVTEYGIDAYHDACGKDGPEFNLCYNTVADPISEPPTSYEDQETHADWIAGLSHEIMSHSSAQPECASRGRGSARCASHGGFVMAWVDEFWKGAIVDGKCKETIRSPKFDPAQCAFKAHVTCPNWNASDQDLCGYFNGAMPDRYINEEWFGLTKPRKSSSGEVDALTPRKAYWRLSELWAGKATRTAAALFLLREPRVDQGFSISAFVLSLCAAFFFSIALVGARCRQHRNWCPRSIESDYVAIA